MVVRDECGKPNHTLRETKPHEIVRKDLVALGNAMMGLSRNEDELETLTEDLLCKTGR